MQFDAWLTTKAKEPFAVFTVIMPLRASPVFWVTLKVRSSVCEEFGEIVTQASLLVAVNDSWQPGFDDVILNTPCPPEALNAWLGWESVYIQPEA